MTGSALATTAAPRSAALTRVRALPAWAWLSAIVLTVGTARWGLAVAHVLPSYIPDEYLYSSLGHSLGEHGTVAVRGRHAPFPALLQPALTAPLWRVGTLHTGLVLVKGLSALAMAGSAVPVYLLARRIRLTQRAALVCAALATVSPNLYFVSFVVSNPISYPLALAALVCAVAALERPTTRSQIGFLAFSGLATFTSIQFIVLPAVLLGAALVVERGRILRVVRGLRLTTTLIAAGSLGVLVHPSTLGFYRHAPHLGAQLSPASWTHWTSLGAFLLAVSAGACFVPGAVAALVSGVTRPRERSELAFAALVVVFALALFTEAASIELQTRIFEERYVMLLAPLLPIAFLLWRRQGFPLRPVAGAMAGVLLFALVLVPTSTYAVRGGSSDSPFLAGVAYLERSLGIGEAGLVVALGASILSLLALLTALRPSTAAVRVAVAAGLVWLLAVSATSTTNSIRSVRIVRAHEPADLGWVDHRGVRDALFVSTAGTRLYDGVLTLFWNPRAVTEEATLGHGIPVDPFGADPLIVAPDGRLQLRGEPLARPFLLDRTGTAVQLLGARPVAEVGGYRLWRPAGTPRLRLLAEGFYADGSLAQTAEVHVWPSTRGTLRLAFAVLASQPAERLTLRAPGLRRTLDLRPGQRLQLSLPVAAGEQYVLRIAGLRGHALNGGPATTGLAATPVFVSPRR